MSRIAALYVQIHSRAPTVPEREQWHRKTRQEAAETIGRFEAAVEDVRKIRDLRQKRRR